jgi:hypothetical protein
MFNSARAHQRFDRMAGIAGLLFFDCRNHRAAGDFSVVLSSILRHYSRRPAKPAGVLIPNFFGIFPDISAHRCAS